MEKTKTLEQDPHPPGTWPRRPHPALAPSPRLPRGPPRSGDAAKETRPKASPEIALADIATNPNQPRTVFNQAAIDELAASIRTHGVLQPVMVRPRAGGRYEIVAGERRYRAALEAGLKRIPAVIRSLTDEESLTVALIENIQREDLNPIEAARAYKQLMDDYGLTQTQLGEQIGKKQSTISNAMSLLKLPEEIQDSISAGKITTEHGKVLLSVADGTKQREIWQEAITLAYSVKQTQVEVDLANFLYSPTKKRTITKSPVQNDIHWDALLDQFDKHST